MIVLENIQCMEDCTQIILHNVNTRRCSYPDHYSIRLAHTQTITVSEGVHTQTTTVSDGAHTQTITVSDGAHTQTITVSDGAHTQTITVSDRAHTHTITVSDWAHNQNITVSGQVCIYVMQPNLVDFYQAC